MRCAWFVLGMLDIYPSNPVPFARQIFAQMMTDETACTGHQYAHRYLPTFLQGLQGCVKRTLNTPLIDLFLYKVNHRRIIVEGSLGDRYYNYP